MLVLTRGADERIIFKIDGEVIMTLTVVEIRSGRKSARVRLGFEADKIIQISREELEPPGEPRTPTRL